jgi:hypothetical protein
VAGLWGHAFDIEQWSALTIALKREQWLYRREELAGYWASAHLHKSRFAIIEGSALIEIQFNGTVRAGITW